MRGKSYYICNSFKYKYNLQKTDEIFENHDLTMSIKDSLQMHRQKQVEIEMAERSISCKQWSQDSKGGCTTIRVTKIARTNHIKCQQGYKGTETIIFCLWRCKIIHGKMVQLFLKTLKIGLRHNSAAQCMLGKQEVLSLFPTSKTKQNTNMPTRKFSHFNKDLNTNVHSNSVWNNPNLKFF